MSEHATIDHDQLKQRHRTLWALGDYPRVADEIVPSLGPILAESCGITAGQRVLDVAAGSGNLANAAARRGADVVAADITAELLSAGREHAEAEGVAIAWEEADAERLPYPDGSFDVVASCIGVMFAPHHQAAADELLRVCRPGGTIGILSWTPTGFVGRMLTAMKPAMPPPPPGAEPAPLWGTVDHVRELFGERVRELTAQARMLTVSAFAAPAEFRRYFATHYGPTVAAYRTVADDPCRTAELDQRLDAVADDAMAADGTMEWEYLIVTARRR
jgi:ubiquinone/menaquinone biosynthesis C-methylase UbiE